MQFTVHVSDLFDAPGRKFTSAVQPDNIPMKLTANATRFVENIKPPKPYNPSLPGSCQDHRLAKAVILFPPSSFSLKNVEHFGPDQGLIKKVETSCLPKA